MVWSPEGLDGRIHFGSLGMAILPALFIIGVAAAVFFSVL